MNTPSPKQCVNVHIRWMIRRDMPEVLEIEQRSFESAWTEEDFLKVLRQRHCIGMVAEHGQTIVGFMVYELRKRSLRVLNFAVHPDWRRQSVGAQMVGKLISKCARLTLELRESNLPAQQFFQRMGFRAVRVLRRFYEDSGEDAYEMEYIVAGEETESGPVNRVAQFDDGDL